MSIAAFDPRRDFFTPSEEWCQKAASRFALREGSRAGGAEEIAAIQHDVGLRLWLFLATVARRAARLGTASLRLASDESFEDDVSSAIGESLGFQVPEDRDLLDHLAAELHAWLVKDNQGRRTTPWGILRAISAEITMEVVPLVQNPPLKDVDRWETKTLQQVPAVAPLRRLKG